MTKEDLALHVIRDGAKRDGWFGKERGIVESIDDPDRLERVRVRIWALHGDDRMTPTSALPWAEVEGIGGGGYDYGSYDPPPTGSGVWVQFESGDPNLPVVTGTFRGIPQRNFANPNVFLTKSGKPDVEKAWLPADGEIETPKDIFSDTNAADPHPTRRVWQKSYKGHTLLIDDGDGKEFIRIIDRAGQVIEMDCSVDSQYSRGNAAQRGTRNVINGDQLPHSIMRNRRAAIRIKDLSGQEIILDSKDQNERIVIKGRSRDGSTENSITIKSGKGKSSIEITDSGGDSIILDPNSNTPISIKDSSGNFILFDKEHGKVSISGAKSSEEATQKKDIVVGGDKTSTVKGSEVKDIYGNKKTNVINDFGLGVLGNTSLSLGGAVKAVITNTAPSGKESVSLDIMLANPSGGDFNVSNLNGDMVISTLIGDVELSTAAGDATLKTTAGDANVDASVGKVLLGNSVTAPSEALLKGVTHNSLLMAYFTSLKLARVSYQTAIVAFNAALTPALILLKIPSVGNTLFAIFMGPIWTAEAAARVAKEAAILIAETTLSSSLTTMLSLKSFTE